LLALFAQNRNSVRKTGIQKIKSVVVVDGVCVSTLAAILTPAVFGINTTVQSRSVIPSAISRHFFMCNSVRIDFILITLTAVVSQAHTAPHWNKASNRQTTICYIAESPVDRSTDCYRGTDTPLRIATTVESWTGDTQTTTVLSPRPEPRTTGTPFWHCRETEVGASSRRWQRVSRRRR